MKIKWIIWAALAIFAIFIIKTLNTAGTFKSIEPHFQGETIKTYSEIYGTEDLQVDNLNGVLFISSCDRRKGNNSQDGIYTLDLNTDDAIPQKLATDLPHSFHPHGISLLREDSLLYVQVVNHSDQGDYIDIFLYQEGKLILKKSVKHPLMSSPNDVVAISPFSFYTSNDHGYSGGFLRKLEDYKVLSGSSILYFDGVEMKTVHNGLSYANGINISKDKKKLYVAETTGRSLLVFNCQDRKEIELIHQQSIPSGLDNIDIDMDGNLWIGSHPKLLAFVSHSKDANKYSPSQALKITPNDEGKEYLVEEIYLDDGSTISGSSVALHYKKELFIGVVFDPILLRLGLE